MRSPLVHQLTAEEDLAAIERMNASGAGIVFVGLGCPKQERWVAEHRGRVQAVMIGVGAAFDFHAHNARKVDTLPSSIMDEVLARLAPIFE